jgi:hypothetical protein
MIRLIQARTGQPTISIQVKGKTIYLHSRYDPIREANELIKKWNVPKDKDLIIYGLGCGHHLRALKEGMDPQQQLIVLECCQEVLDAALRHGLITDLLEDSRFRLISIVSLQDFAENLSNCLQAVQKGTASFYVHGPSLKAIPEDMEQIRILLEEYHVQASSLAAQQKLLLSNVERVRPYLYDGPNVSVFSGCFDGVPAIIAAAGPSLSDVLPILANVKDQAVIFCVGTALQALQQHNVNPDFVVVIEADSRVIRQFEGVKNYPPLIAFPTASPDLTLSYPGTVIWAFPDGIEELILEAEKLRLTTVSSGGSVTTAALSIAGLMGCNPIIFVGCDFAYVKGRTHASGTIYDGERVSSTSTFMRYTEAVGGGSIQTSVSWDIFRKWVERYISEHSSVQFYNASMGARISGTVEKNLHDLIHEGLLSKNYGISERIINILGSEDRGSAHDKNED